MKVAVAFFALVASPVIASPKSPPFGIAQNTPIKSLKVQHRYGSKYFVVSPPIRNPNFAEYTVIATPLQGVCAVIAETVGFPTAREATAKFRAVVRLLAGYGTPTQVKPGVGWSIMDFTIGDMPVQWKRQLPNGLDSIVAEPVKDGTAFKVEVSYFYRNMSHCSMWEPNQDRRGL